MPHSYDKRLLHYAIGSAVLHIIGIVTILYFLFAHPGTGPAKGPVTYTVQLGTTPPEPKELAENTVPTTEPPPTADKIAETDSRAQDQSDVEGKRNAPFFKQTAETDIISKPVPTQTAAQTVPPQPSPQTPPQQTPAQSPISQQPTAVPPSPPPPKPTENKPNSIIHPEPEKTPTPPARPVPVSSDAIVPRDPSTTPQSTTPGTPNSIPPSQTPTPTSTPPAPATDFKPPVSPLALPTGQPVSGTSSPAPDTTRGTIDGGVKNEGFLANEAIRDKVAPYLKSIRSRVERNWQTALHLKYLGTTPTKAVLDCVIGQNGQLISVTIVDPGSATGYAPICKEAIEKAAPFDPFPFQVPEMYRNKNLEIRWTFSFLPQ